MKTMAERKTNGQKKTTIEVSKSTLWDLKQKKVDERANTYEELIEQTILKED
jgi:hypothetical protein